MEKKTLGSFLSALRRAQGLTQQEVADRLMVSNRAVSRWERDEAMPDILLLPAIADLFGVTVDELLRGERKREAYSPPETDSKSSADSTATEQPASEATQPEPDPRALRGLRSLTKRAVTSFRTCIIVSFAVALAGIFTMGIISYGFYRPTIGFSVLLIFLIASITTAILSATRLRDVINEQFFSEETRLPDAELRAICRFYAAGLSRAIWTVITAVLVTLPLVLIRDEKFVHSVLSAESYAPMALAIGLGCMAAIICLNGSVMRMLCRPWEDVIPYEEGIPSLPKPIRRRLWYMSLVQLGSFSIGLTLCIICNATDRGYQTFIDEYTRINWTSLACTVLGALICLIAPFFFLKGQRRLQKTLSLPPSLWAMGKVVLTSLAIRNLLLVLTIFLTLGFGLTFGSSSIDGVTHYYQHWDDQVIFIGILLFIAIIAGEYPIRKRLMQKKV